METQNPAFHSLSLLLFFAAITTSAAALNADGLALLALKSAVTADPTSALSAWIGSAYATPSSPCDWPGVSCRLGRVDDLSLPGKSLSGYLPSELAALSALRRLSLPYNAFSGPIPPDLLKIPTLTYIDLSGNSLSGAIPPEIGTLAETLTHLDLSSNLLNGSLPPFLADFKSLSGTLNLSFNAFSGQIPPDFGRFSVAVSLDLRHNNLSGEIPQAGTLLNQGPTAFDGNPNLCGFPLKFPCAWDRSSELPSWSPNPNPSSSGNHAATAARRRTAVTISVLAAVLLISAAAVAALQWRMRRRRRRKSNGGFFDGGGGKEERLWEGSPPAAAKGDEDYFVAVDEGFQIELEELLRASAYVVGKSRSGIVYKVVVSSGGGGGPLPSAVAVRRLSEGVCAGWRRREFEAAAAMMGQVRHPNIVRLRAYYYAPVEKLLVSDFISNGSLHSALHGGGVGGLSHSAAPLTWAARLDIVRGAARGLAYIHECGHRKHAHGNVKSSKILLDEDLNPYVSDFGLARLVALSKKNGSNNNGSTDPIVHGFGSKMAAGARSGYMAPEAGEERQWMSQKGDVYAFGVVLMEVLTGRAAVAGLEGFVRGAFREERSLSEIVDPALLHEVHAKKQVLVVFHVALGCTEADPEARPRMRGVSESLDRIGGGGR
ncbi:putative inactive leucine-rich repeat receptor-like protein kinase [Acorus gramineus]|uniref:Inactive leucine-rich repeat receptor-like protein kinase n=1 Tax=Acorus gramineus TaxID=55184 RepID=A0AAV9A4R3_ACOGR|nr:putative inactive leucine-rich repeat receptor-like protein kinase [Acorus gramineus]